MPLGVKITPRFYQGKINKWSVIRLPLEEIPLIGEMSQSDKRVAVPAKEKLSPKVTDEV